MSGDLTFNITERENSEHTMFKYDNFNNFEELKSHSLSLFREHQEITPETTTTYTCLAEKERSIEAINSKQTLIREEEVSYYASTLGYRINRPLDEIKEGVGAFGCSFTYGVGMPYERTYSTLLGEKLNEPVFNFGIPGAGIQKITRAFCSINSFYRLKTAIFVFSGLHRYEFVGENKNKEPYAESYIPAWPPNQNQERYNLIYEHFDDTTFFNEFMKNLAIIKYNAEKYGTKVLFTSWCHYLPRLAKKYGVKDIEQNPILFLEKTENLARDGMHPGFGTHIATAEQLYNLLTPFKYSSKTPKRLYE
jgi:hypothetical protein